MRSFTATYEAHRRRVQLDQYAWANRHTPTESEARLWSALCARKLGVCFRRQAPLGGRYIADFLAPTVRLVVEVDGGYHAERRWADARRDRVLGRLGYRVLRFSSTLVRTDLDAAVRLVRAAL